TSEYFYYGGYYNGFYSVPLLGSLAGPSTPLIVYGVRIAPWIVYSGISLLLSALLVLASTLLIKPHSFQRLWRAHRKVKAGPVVPEGGAE
ncbi:MAG: hypothetical protein J2P36_05245, partial [Ktedonobacteraceae bacterium]|nr:hypothetical protein [Ktedonobacteraceae bacterium]